MPICAMILYSERAVIYHSHTMIDRRNLQFPLRSCALPIERENGSQLRDLSRLQWIFLCRILPSGLVLRHEY